MTAVSGARDRVAARREASYRYGVVLGIVIAFVVLEVLSPDADWSRAIGIALAGAALSVSVATSRQRAEVRRVRTMVVVGLALILVIGIWTGVFSDAVTFVLGSAVVAAIPIALIGGLLRLINDEGVTVQAVAGAIAIYLLIAMLFASAIGFISAVDSSPYFTQQHVNNGDLVYYSFTVMTTTGFGDYTAAQPIGHALAVLEMLIGQLYLVTVLGILIGNFAGRRLKK